MGNFEMVWLLQFIGDLAIFVSFFFMQGICFEPFGEFGLQASGGEGRGGDYVLYFVFLLSSAFSSSISLIILICNVQG